MPPYALSRSVLDSVPGLIYASCVSALLVLLLFIRVICVGGGCRRDPLVYAVCYVCPSILFLARSVCGCCMRNVVAGVELYSRLLAGNRVMRNESGNAMTSTERLLRKKR